MTQRREVEAEQGRGLAQFSRKMGISPATLHRLEMGEQNVTLKTLEQICDRLKCTVTEMFGED